MASSSGFETNTMLLGRYRVDATLGEGSFGTVVRAFDTRLKRTVAIKTLKRAVAATDLEQFRAIEERFAREAEAGSRMGIHTNLVTVHDLVIEPDRTQYLILEYVRGGTLAERLMRGSLPLSEALRVTADMARGLQAAHDVGIVHRDVKPANIFLTPDGRAQLGDFGIAQIDDVSGRTHAVVGHPGTPLYMSPEQAQTTGYVRPASDQYSLGLVCFEMLTGRAYKRIGERAATALLADQPAPVANLIEDMIATAPDDRLASCDRVARQIAAIVRNLGLTETQLAVEPPVVEHGRATSRPPGVLSAPGSASSERTRPLAPDEINTVYTATEDTRRISDGGGSGGADAVTSAVASPGTAHLDAAPVLPVIAAIPPAYAGSPDRSRRGLTLAAVVALLLILVGGGVAWALRGAGGTSQVTQTPQQAAAPLLAAATIAATVTVIPTPQQPTVIVAPPTAPRPTVAPTVTPTSAPITTAVPPTAVPTPIPPTVPPVPAPSQIAVFSVGTTNANLDTVNGDDVVTAFTAGQDVYGFINFGGAQVGKDVLEVTVVANGTPQPPQPFTLQKGDGFQVFLLGKLGAGDYRLEVRYAGKVAQTADFRVSTPAVVRPQPTAVPRTNPSNPSNPAIPVQPTAVVVQPTSAPVATVAPRPTVFIPPTQPPPKP